MSDITERLRTGVYGINRIALCAEAADTIDSLRAEVAVLQMACSRWERALEHGADRIRNAESERDSLRAQVEALRADAERLHWVETQAIRIADECQNNDRWLVETLTSSATGETLRAAIDAARSQEAAG